jgi:hypothetical protein
MPANADLTGELVKLPYHQGSTISGNWLKIANITKDFTRVLPDTDPMPAIVVLTVNSVKLPNANLTVKSGNWLKIANITEGFTRY